MKRRKVHTVGGLLWRQKERERERISTEEIKEKEREKERQRGRMIEIQVCEFYSEKVSLKLQSFTFYNNLFKYQHTYSVSHSLTLLKQLPKSYPDIHNETDQNQNDWSTYGHRRPSAFSVSLGACLIVILGQGMITDDEELIRKIHSNQGQGHLPLRRNADVMRWG